LLALKTEEFSIHQEPQALQLDAKKGSIPMFPYCYHPSHQTNLTEEFMAKKNCRTKNEGRACSWLVFVKKVIKF